MDTSLSERVARLNYWTQHYFEARQFDQAQEYARKAYDLAHDLPVDDQFRLQSVNNLATFLQMSGNYTAAEPLFIELIDIARQSTGEENTDFATFQNNLGLLYRRMGRYDNAASCYQRALDLRRRLLGENHLDTVQTANNLAIIYFLTGDYAGAYPIMEEVVSQRQAYLKELLDLMPHSSQYLGYAVGEYSDGLNNLAAIALNLQQFEQAKEFHEEARYWRTYYYGPTHPNVAQSYHNLAHIYDLLGFTELAEQHYQQALEIRTAELGDAHPDTAQTAANLAVFRIQQGDSASGEPLLLDVLENRLASLGERHPLVAQTRYNLAALYAKTDRPDLAIETLSAALDAENSLTRQAFSIGSEIQRQRYLALLQPGYRLYLSLLRQYAAADPQRVLDGFSLVQNRKGLAAEALAVQRDSILGGRYPHLAAELAELTGLRAQIAQKILAGPGAENAALYRQVLEVWENEKNQLEAALASQIPEIGLQAELAGVTPQALAEALPPGSALVEFVSFTSLIFLDSQPEPEYIPRTLAFILLAGQPVRAHLVDLGETAEIAGKIGRFRQAVTGEEYQGAAKPEEAEFSTRSSSEELRAALLTTLPLSRQVGSRPKTTSTHWVEAGQSLRKAVFDPLLPFLEDRRQLFLAPDGDLTRLPFETLPLEQDRFLLDTYQISYLSVGRDLLRFNRQPAALPEKPLVLADPDYDLTAQSETGFQAGQPFRRLAGTREEGKLVGMQLKVEPLSAGQAQESRLKKLSSPHILHLATHGFFLPDLQAGEASQELFLAGGLEMSRFERLRQVPNPLLRSGLALAGANAWLQSQAVSQESEDGLLTAEDVTGLDLTGTELVVLSACDTGLGDIQAGEGVFGLRRAFTLAGARTLLMSLWKVPDQATRSLMEFFYINLIDKKMGRAAALRQAQLELRKEHPDPFYWGAFICQGDPGPLPELMN
jgi:CHAT domain-containing protein/tetratricopeptide (TPR) repeat protein